jgi:hypothetical protein
LRPEELPIFPRFDIYSLIDRVADFQKLTYGPSDPPEFKFRFVRDTLAMLDAKSKKPAIRNQTPMTVNAAQK